MKLRSPNAGNANNVRNVNPSGSLNNNNANNGNGSAPDCMNARNKVGNEIKPYNARNCCPSRKGEE